MPFINADLLADQFARALARPPAEPVAYAVVDPHTGQLLDPQVPYDQLTGDATTWMYDPFTGQVLDNNADPLGRNKLKRGVIYGKID